MANLGGWFRSIRPWVLSLAVTATLGLSIWSDYQERFVSGAVDNSVARYAGFDAQMGRATQGDGVFLHFVNFPPELSWVALDFYSRAVYALYPRRVLVADPGTPIFDFDQLRARNLDPDAAWLARNGTPVEVSYSIDPETGGLAWTAQRVSGGMAGK